MNDTPPEILKNETFILGPINELVTALCKAQMEIKQPEKTKSNNHYNSDYADLSAVQDCSKVILAKYGLVVLQFCEGRAPNATVITFLIHTSGQQLRTVLTLRSKADSPQDMGSAFTYAKRYAQCGVLNICKKDDDDDGNIASGIKDTKHVNNAPKKEDSSYKRNPDNGNSSQSTGYEIDFGKFKGKKISELDKRDLQDYIVALLKGAEEKKENPSAQLNRLMTEFKKHYAATDQKSPPQPKVLSAEDYPDEDPYVDGF